MQKTSWSKRLRSLGAIAAILAVVILVIAGPGHRFGLLPFKFAVLGSALAALIAVFAFVVTLIGALLKSADGETATTARTAITLLVSGAIAVQLLIWINTAFSVPPIHDISTDTGNPPAFSALVAARADAMNPVAYAGDETADAQRSAYPDIQPLVFADVTPARALEAAEAAARKLGWDPIIVSASDGRLEATDTTFWFGYKDDVVVRVTAEGDGARVDVRSKSRVGQSDLGTNAQRVRDFGAALRAELGVPG